MGALALGLILPFSPVAGYLGLDSLPFSFFAFLIGAVVVYLVLVNLAKDRFFRRHSLYGQGCGNWWLTSRPARSKVNANGSQLLGDGSSLVTTWRSCGAQ